MENGQTVNPVTPELEENKTTSQLQKIYNIRQKINQIDRNIDLEVDGGINNETNKMAIEAGANVLVSGSYIFGNNNYFSN